MKTLIRTAAYSGVLLALPMVVAAQGTDPGLDDTVGDFVAQLGAILNTLLPILVTIAVLAFFWGLALFIFNAGDEQGRDKGKNIMFWGIIALFVMVSIWGIVGFIGNVFGIESGDETPVPGVQQESGGTGFGG